MHGWSHIPVYMGTYQSSRRMDGRTEDGEMGGFNMCVCARPCLHVCDPVCEDGMIDGWIDQWIAKWIRVVDGWTDRRWRDGWI